MRPMKEGSIASYLGSIVVFALTLILIPLPAFAGTTYYVDCSAETNGDGSYSSPWNNIQSVNNHVFETGDDVYFRVNTTCTPSSRFVVDWGGSIDDQATIGSYYGDMQFGLNGNSRPVINGQNTVPSSNESPLVGSNGYTHLTVRDLNIINSAGYGISIKDSDYSTIESCHTDHTYRYGVGIAITSNSTISDNVINDAYYWTNVGDCIDVTALSDAGTSQFNTVARNVLSNCNEGIGIYKKNEHITVEYNVIYDSCGPNVYVDASQSVTIRYNIMYTSTEGGLPYRGRGVMVDNETARNYCYGNDDIRIYGNLIANMSQGINIQNHYGNAVDSNCNTTSVSIFNNTLVDNNYNIRIVHDDGGWTGNEIRNNLSLLYSVGRVHTNNDSPAGFSWDRNLWYGVDTVGGNAANNAVTEDPLLSRTSGWSSLTPGEIDGNEFALQEGSAAIDAGITLDAEYALDFLGTSRPQGAAWDIGAHEYTVPGTTCDDLGGMCCEADESCDGGTFIEASDCGNRCCSGGACQVDDLLLRASRARETLEIDGQFDEPAWSETASVTFSDPSGVSDNTIVVRALWDDDAVYIAFEIDDADLRTGDGDVWDDDSVELFIDPELNRGERFQPDDIQVIVNTVSDSFYAHGESRTLPETVTFGVWTGEGGYDVEMRLTWEEIGREPATGLRMGLDAVNNDRDEDETRHYYDWANLEVFHFPAGWGVLELTGDDDPGADGDGDVDADGDGDADGDADAGDEGDAELDKNDGISGDTVGACECSIVATRAPLENMGLVLSILGLLAFASLRRWS